MNNRGQKYPRFLLSSTSSNGFLLLPRSGLSGWGTNTRGQLGLGNVEEVKTLTRIPFYHGKKVLEVGTGEGHSIILTKRLNIYVCGSNEHLECFFPKNHWEMKNLRTAKSKSMFSGCTEPLEVDVGSRGLHPKKVAAGGYFSYILCKEGLYGSGSNSEGNLGCGRNKSAVYFKKIPVFEGAVLACITHIECGYAHSVILSVGHGIYVAGRNNHGFNTNCYEFTKLGMFEKPGNNCTAIASGNCHTLFLTDTGVGYGAGFNIYGQLGTSDSNSLYGHVLPSSKVAMPLKIGRLITGGCHSGFCAQNGTYYICGQNSNKQCGFKGENALTPTRIETEFFRGKVLDLILGVSISLLTTTTGIYATGDEAQFPFGLDLSIDKNGFKKSGGGGSSRKLNEEGKLTKELFQMSRRKKSWRFLGEWKRLRLRIFDEGRTERFEFLATNNSGHFPVFQVSFV